MLLELVLALFFLVVIIFQATQIREMLVFGRKTIGMYIVMAIGCLILLGITYYHGKTIVHWITGLLGIILFIASLFVTGVSKDSFYTYSPPKRFIGQKIRFKDSKNIRLETFHEKKLIV